MSYMLIGSTGTVVFEKTATVTDESYGVNTGRFEQGGYQQPHRGRRQDHRPRRPRPH